MPRIILALFLFSFIIGCSSYGIIKKYNKENYQHVSFIFNKISESDLGHADIKADFQLIKLYKNDKLDEFQLRVQASKNQKPIQLDPYVYISFLETRHHTKMFWSEKSQMFEIALPLEFADSIAKDYVLQIRLYQKEKPIFFLFADPEMPGFRKFVSTRPG